MHLIRCHYFNCIKPKLDLIYFDKNELRNGTDKINLKIVS